ncbi:MAG TPA: hypothetical protein VLU25_06770, partial [Acidobacteriota bacterium]|nr:hypothetical protein [Acidobacteriota bacterium]
MSPGGNKRARPPLGRMLERILPAEWRQDIAGDLEADWRRRRTGAGRARAALWYLRQLAGYLLRWRQIRKLAHVSAPAHSQRRRSKESWMHSLLQDVRLAARSLKRNPGLALVVIVTLALGIGANTAIFSLTDEVLLRSLPVADPERLVAVEGQRADGRVSISYPLFTELQEQQTVLTGLMADAGAGLERVELEGQ